MTLSIRKINDDYEDELLCMGATRKELHFPNYSETEVMAIKKFLNDVDLFGVVDIRIMEGI